MIFVIHAVKSTIYIQNTEYEYWFWEVWYYNEYESRGEMSGPEAGSCCAQSHITVLTSQDNKTRHLEVLAECESFLSSFSPSITAAKTSCYPDNITVTSHPHKWSFHHPRLPAMLTADDFANFFYERVATIGSWFSAAKYSYKPPLDRVHLPH